MRALHLTMLTAVGLALSLGQAACSDGSSSGEDPKSTTWTRDTLIAACVRMHSCGVFRLTHVQQCIHAYEEKDVTPYGLAPLHQKLHLCVNQAKGDCDQVRACFGASKWDIEKLGSECDAKYSPGCDGTVMRYCDLSDKRIYRIDCAKGGLTCSTDSNGQPFCGQGTCDAQKDKPKCSPDKTQRLACVGNGWQIKQCDWISLVCGLDRDSKYDCVGTGKQCSG